MFPICLHTRIGILDGIKSGSRNAGSIPIELTDEQVAQLRDEQLVETAALFMGGCLGDGVKHRELAAPSLAVTAPGWEAAIAALRALRDERTRHAAALESAQREYDAQLMSELDGPHVPTVELVQINAAGKLTEWASDAVVSKEVTVYVPPLCAVEGVYRTLSDSSCERLIGGPAVESRRYAAAEERKAIVTAAREALLPGLRAELGRILAEREAETARVQRDYDAFYTRLPDLLRRRHADGFATTREIHVEIAKLMRRDAGYRGHDGFANHLDLKVLTDEEYAALLVARATAPDGASVDPISVFDEESEPCEVHDAYVSECDECVCKRTNERSLAWITWVRGGVEATAYLALGTTWGKTEGAHDYATRRESEGAITAGDWRGPPRTAP